MSGLGVFLAAWLLLGTLLLAWALGAATPKTERTLHTDIATHVMIASSMWVDGDYKYTLKDLQRFREDFPAVDGPRGLFLKQADSGSLFFAKPYLYGTVAAPFYGLFGVGGFIVLNVLCVVVIGAVAGLALSRALGRNWGLVASIAFVFPSAFLPWVFIPHPDVFIAALLALGGFLLLLDRTTRPWQVLGALILGAALHEKIPFIFVLPFLVAAVPTTSWSWRGALGVIVMLSWLMFSLPNIAIDGSLFSYQGLRLFTLGNPYPLEAGWSPPTTRYLDHVFDPLAVVLAILSNLGLIWEKFLDFLVGRQTGIIPYFATGAALLLIRPFFGPSRSLLLLAGLFSYLSVQWVGFPLDGYGGHSYGSRYLMQAIPLVPLAYLNVRPLPGGAQALTLQLLVKGMLVVAVVLALVTQHRVFTHGDGLVKHYYTANIQPPLNAFRLERWLLGFTLSAGAPNMYVDESVDRRVRLFRVDETERGSWLRLTKKPDESTFILYKHDMGASLPPIEVISPLDTEATIEISGEIIWSGLLLGHQPMRVAVDYPTSFRTAFDLVTRREVGLATLKLKVDHNDRYSDGTVRHPLVRFATDPKPFERFSERLGVKDLVAGGAELRGGWGHPESWGVWSDGLQADIALRVRQGELYYVELATHAYIPPERGKLEVGFRCNGSMSEPAVYGPEQFQMIGIACRKRAEDEYVVIGVDVVDPTSPLAEGRGADPRRLGIGLHTVRIDRVE